MSWCPHSAPRKDRWPGPVVKMEGGKVRKWWVRSSWLGMARVQFLRCISAPLTEECCPLTWHGRVLGIWAPWGKGIHCLLLRPSWAPSQVQSHGQSRWWDLAESLLSSWPILRPVHTSVPETAPGGHMGMKRAALQCTELLAHHLFHLRHDLVKQLLLLPPLSAHQLEA